MKEAGSQSPALSPSPSTMKRGSGVTFMGDFSKYEQGITLF